MEDVDSQAPPQTIAGRYRIERALGAGGMATVYEVFDLRAERRLALKRLHALADSAKRQRTVELFEREFHTLVHLAHPRVVEAYDYGVDEGGPYYTMELLEGGDLSQLAPLPWKRACELARDVCSALSLVHSRRLVYRDLNPRNVRCTSDQRAKLIDFGALCPVGPSKQVVGTPAYCAPETLDFAPLDARTDLYSVGATLYFMLTGRHAYPARSFEQLRLLWEGRPLRPAEIVPEVPLALDNLVMDLLHPEASVRPANAAEVIEQLAIIEGRTLEEQLQVTLSYLSTPSLVGRDAMLDRTRTKITRAQRSRGGVLLFEGASGVGRSRIVAACRLEAKLQGLLTLQADASDAHVDYGLMQALTAQLLSAAPQLALECAQEHLPLLVHALPGLLALRPETQPATLDITSLRPALLCAQRDWLLAITRKRPLLIAVDDFHLIDEPSAAVMALLARSLENYGLLLIASSEAGATPTAPAAVKALRAAATVTPLENLSLADAERLLRSVFGDVPNVQLVTHRLHAISQGNPRDLMQLAQDLVDRKLATFRGGAWSLPSSIEAADLPDDMAQALKRSVQALGPLARRLGLALTLTPDRGLTFEECGVLCEGEGQAQLIAALDELQRIQAITLAIDVYSIGQRGFALALQQDTNPEQRRPQHALLARVFEAREGEAFRRAQHLVRAGQLDQGLSVLIEFAIDSKQRTDKDASAFRSLAAALPDDWQQFFVDCVAQAAAHRPAHDTLVLRLRFASLVNVMAVPISVANPVIRDCVAELAFASGLDLIPAQKEPDAATRARNTLVAAQQRHDQSPPEARLATPLLALKELSRALISSCGLITNSLDYSLGLALPSLAGFRVLAPAFEVVERLRCGALERLSGRFEEACRIYRDLLEYSDRPDYCGLDISNHRYMRYGVMGALGLMEAARGQPSCLQWAAKIELEPLYIVSAFQIRMLHALWEGRVHDADKHKVHFELLRIQSAPRQISDGPYLVASVIANAASDDLTRIKQTADDIATMAERHAPWWMVSEYARGEYDRIRGKAERALGHFDTVLAMCTAGTNVIWSYAAGARVRVLRALGRCEEARREGEAYLAQAERVALSWHWNFIRMPLALAYSELGEHDGAAALADRVIEEFERAGSQGLPLVLAYEARCQVALAADDVASYERALAGLAEHARKGQGRGLRAKYEKLKQSSRDPNGHSIDPGGEANVTVLTGTQMRSLLAGCTQARERAERSLQLLLRRSGATEGVLYLHRERGRELAAHVGELLATEGLTRFLDEFVQSNLDDQALSTRTQASSAEEMPTTSHMLLGADGARHHVLLLSHQTPQGFAITGLAVLRAPTEGRFEQPTSLASSLSHALLEAGDVVPMLVR